MSSFFFFLFKSELNDNLLAWDNITVPIKHVGVFLIVLCIYFILNASSAPEICDIFLKNLQ